MLLERFAELMIPAARAGRRGTSPRPTSPLARETTAPTPAGRRGTSPRPTWRGSASRKPFV